jgi:hypothetical protein
VRRSGGSIVVITLATPEALRRIWGWEVATEEETASDHRYIRMMVSPLIAPPALAHSRPGTESPRWSLRQLNEDALMAAALAVAFFLVRQEKCVTHTPDSPGEGSGVMWDCPSD